MKHNLVLALKGAAIGGTMLVPGVSGGTMAMMLNIYDKLILALSTFRRHKRASLKVLAWFCAGAAVGMVLLAQPLSRLMGAFPHPVGYFFVGAVLGSVPLVYRKASVQRISWRVPVYILLGAGIALLLSVLPSVAGSGGGAFHPLLLLPIGVVAAAALVLPGISISHLMLVLGLYDKLLQAISCLDFVYLLPFGIGMLLGIALTVKALERMLSKHPQATYLLILGFMIASVAAVFPGLPPINEAAACLVAALAGFGLLYGLSHRRARA